MEGVARHSIDRAIEHAVHLWAFSSTQFPQNNLIVVDRAHVIILDKVSIFSLNARRALEILPRNRKFILNQSRWQWGTSENHEHVRDLFDALNRIIHAQTLDIGFVRIPEDLSVIQGGAVVVPFIKAKTDRRPISFIDLFALSHSFLYEAVPELNAIDGNISVRELH